MALKDVWIPQDETMDASPEIPNMLASAIIQNETDIKELKDGGGSGGSGEDANVVFVDVTEWFDLDNGELKYKIDQSYRDIYNKLTKQVDDYRTRGITVIARYDGVQGALISDIFYLEDWELDYMTFTSVNGTVVKTLVWNSDETVTITTQTLATTDQIGDIETSLENIIAKYGLGGDAS